MPQNHKTVEVGRHLWRSPSPTPLLKVRPNTAGCPELCVQLHFEHLQGQRLHNLSTQPVSVFNHPHSYVWKSGGIFHYSVGHTDNPGQAIYTDSLEGVPRRYALGDGRTHW